MHSLPKHPSYLPKSHSLPKHPLSYGQGFKQSTHVGHFICTPTLRRVLFPRCAGFSICSSINSTVLFHCSLLGMLCKKLRPSTSYSGSLEGKGRYSAFWCWDVCLSPSTHGQQSLKQSVSVWSQLTLPVGTEFDCFKKSQLLFFHLFRGHHRYWRFSLSFSPLSLPSFLSFFVSPQL